MYKKLKLVKTGEKSRVITFRLGETIYEALEKMAQETGGTVSATARSLLVDSLSGAPLNYRAGDTLKAEGFGTSSAMYVVLGGEMPTTDSEVSKKVEELLRGTKFDGVFDDK